MCSDDDTSLVGVGVLGGDDDVGEGLSAIGSGRIEDVRLYPPFGWIEGRHQIILDSFVGITVGHSHLVEFLKREGNLGG